MHKMFNKAAVSYSILYWLADSIQNAQSYPLLSQTSLVSFIYFDMETLSKQVQLVFTILD